MESPIKKENLVLFKPIRGLDGKKRKWNDVIIVESQKNNRIIRKFNLISLCYKIHMIVNPIITNPIFLSLGSVYPLCLYPIHPFSKLWDKWSYINNSEG